MRESDAADFDQAWNNMAERVGFNYQGNRLGYAKHGSRSNVDFRQQNQPDDARSGHYLPLNQRAQDAPVIRNRDIGPTQP